MIEERMHQLQVRKQKMLNRERELEELLLKER